MSWFRSLVLRFSSGASAAERSADVTDRGSREMLEKLAVDFETVRADMSRMVKRLESNIKEANP